MAKKAAEKIDKVKVVKGRLIRVANKDKPKLSNAKNDYLALWVEDANGKDESCLLFTDKEIEEARYRASRNKEDLTKKGFLVDLFD